MPHKTSLALTLALTATLLLTACENVTVTWAPNLQQGELEAGTDCHLGVVPTERGAVIFQLNNCRIGTTANVQLSNGDVLYVNEYRQQWTPNPRRIETRYGVRVALINGSRTPTGRISIGNLYYAW
jgi:hypothetical protein